MNRKKIVTDNEKKIKPDNPKLHPIFKAILARVDLGRRFSIKKGGNR